jgi:hypothetical protein
MTLSADQSVTVTSSEPERLRTYRSRGGDNRPHLRIAEYASQLMGAKAAAALAVLFNPRTGMHQSMRRRALDMLYPKDRPVPLAIGDIKSPSAYDHALEVVHLAWTSGQISPAEAESCMRLVNARYRGWLKSRAGAGVR